MNINNSAYFNYLIIYLFILRKNKKKDTGCGEVTKLQQFYNDHCFAQYKCAKILKHWAPHNAF